MQNQFKAGDLALIVGSTGRRPSLIGRTIVLCERQWFAHQSEYVWTWSDNGLEECTAERHLMPLKGDQSPAQTSTETPKEVVHG